MGKTLDDQDKIDVNVARGCAAGVYTSEACARHTTASAERRKELGGAGALVGDVVSSAGV